MPLQLALFAALGLGCVGFAGAQPGYAQPPPIAAPNLPPFRFDRLDNELRIAAVEDRCAGRVSVQLWIGRGCDNDPVVTESIADAARRAAIAVAGAPPSAPGMQVTSFTTPDATAFTIAGPPSGLTDALAWTARLLQAAPSAPANPPGAGIATTCQHGCAPERWALDANEAAALAAAFQIGDAAISREKTPTDTEITAFLHDWYATANAFVLVYGDVDVITALDAARSAFGGLPWRSMPPRRRAAPNSLRRGVATPLGMARRIDLVWTLPPAAYAEHGSIDVLGQYLTNPIDGALTTGTGAPVWRRYSRRDVGYGILSLSRPSWRIPLPNCVSDAAAEWWVLQGVIRELRRIVDAPPDFVRLTRARALGLAELRGRRASFAARALDFGLAEMVSGDLLIATFAAEQLETVRAIELRIAATELWEQAPAIVGRVRAAPGANRRHTVVTPAMSRCHSAGHAASLRDLAAESTGAGVYREVVGPVGAPVRIANGCGPSAALAVELAPHAAQAWNAPESDARPHRRELADYCSFHGIEFVALESPGEILLIRAPAGREVAALEVLERCLRELAAGAGDGEAVLRRAAVVTPTSPVDLERELSAVIGSDAEATPEPDAPLTGKPPSVDDPITQALLLLDATPPGTQPS